MSIATILRMLLGSGLLAIALLMVAALACIGLAMAGFDRIVATLTWPAFIHGGLSC
jgi:hypothetical protein